jgi:hypothetical protein
MTLSLLFIAASAALIPCLMLWALDLADAR